MYSPKCIITKRRFKSKVTPGTRVRVWFCDTGEMEGIVLLPDPDATTLVVIPALDWGLYKVERHQVRDILGEVRLSPT